MAAKITKIKLSDQIFQNIKQMIITHEYLPGEMLQIDRLASEFDVSTTPIREALLKLESEGLVEIAPNKSAIVTQVDECSVRDLWGFRMLLEGSAARSAALNAGSSEIEDLEKDLLKLLDDPCNNALYVATEKKLDRLLLENTENKLIREALENLKNKSERVMYFTTEKATGYLRIKEFIITITKEHLEIVEALKRRDQDLARQKVEEHLQKAMERTLEAIGRYSSRHYE